MNERVTRRSSEPSGRSRPTLRPQVRIMARIKRLSYRTGFVERLAEAAHLPHLPAITFEAADLTEDVVALVDAHLLDLGGTYGDPEAGDPHAVRPCYAGTVKARIVSSRGLFIRS